MTLFKNKYRIESTRLPSWDYSLPGYYFITICTKDREMFFGDIVVKTQDIASSVKMQLSKIGKIAERCWLEIPKHFPFVSEDEHIVMPNHIHGILGIMYDDTVETQNLAPTIGVETQNFVSLPVDEYKNKFGPQSKNISSIIRGFKIGVKKYATMQGIDFAWHPRFYDHIIKNEKELNKIRQYIIDNPSKWERDRNNLENSYM